MIEEIDGCMEKLEALQHHETIEVYEKVVDILGNFFMEEEDGEEEEEMDQ